MNRRKKVLTEKELLDYVEETSDDENASYYSTTSDENDSDCSTGR